MLNLLHIALEAHNPERNHHRAYAVELGRDLLGTWVVGIRYGRAGAAGGLPQTFSGRHASCARTRHSRSFGCGFGFQSVNFRFQVMSMQVRQRATPLQTARGKTLRQALRVGRRSKAYRAPALISARVENGATCRALRATLRIALVRRLDG
jgi:hypothetical protein